MIEVGQKVYVTMSGFVKIKPNLEEYTVTAVNTVSFYAIRNGVNSEIRFNKRKMEAKGAVYHYKAYLEPETYWKKVKEAEESEELRGAIGESIKYLDLPMLRKIKEYIDENAQ